MTAAAPRGPTEYLEEVKRPRRSAARRGEMVEGHQVYVPVMVGELARRLERAGDGWEDVDFREVRYAFKTVGRGGTGYVWIGHHMVEPQEFYNALTEVEGYESDTRSEAEVGFTWWIEGGKVLHTRDRDGKPISSTRFKLIPTVAGWCILERYGSYGAIREIFKVADLVKAFGLLGVLEEEGAQVLAPPVGRPRELGRSVPKDAAPCVDPPRPERRLIAAGASAGAGAVLLLDVLVRLA